MTMQPVATIRTRIAGSRNGARRNQYAGWSGAVGPYVTAARQGAAHAARTVGRERARARSGRAWWPARWAAPAAIGVVFAGVAGGVLIGMARRQARSGDPRHSSGAPRSGMNSRQSRIGGSARTMFDRFRPERGDGARGREVGAQSSDAGMANSGMGAPGMGTSPGMGTGSGMGTSPGMGTNSAMGGPGMGNGAASDHSGSASSGPARMMPTTGTG